MAAAISGKTHERVCRCLCRAISLEGMIRMSGAGTRSLTALYVAAPFSMGYVDF